MAIYRGPGGPGDAVNDAASEVLLALAAKDAAIAAQVAAEAAQAAAELAETNAETAETNAETAETNAETAETNAETAATNAASSASAASTSASNAASSASAASTSASNAASSASAASTSASNAASSASAASTSASNASSSATAAANSATAAQAAQTAAEAAFDQFDDIYLGAKSSNPTVDNDGNALTTGDQYFNTVSNELRVWNGSSWQAASTVGGTVTSLNVTGAFTAAGPIDIGSDGTAASPALRRSTDTNTGLYFPAADSIGLATGGTVRLRIDSNGNTQLGGASSSSRLNIVGNDAITMQNAGQSHELEISFPSAQVAEFTSYHGSGSNLTFRTTPNAGSPTERMRIDSSGNVGIGTTTPTAPLQVNGTITATSVNTNNTFGFKNRIINGGMMVHQRGGTISATGTVNTYGLDRFAMRTTSGSAVVSMQQSTTAPTGFYNSLLCTVTTPDSSLAAGDLTVLFQKIEGVNVSDLGWGTANAQAVTISFRVRSSITGTYGVGVQNDAGNRSYPSSFVINSADTWETKTITIAGDTTGTWNLGTTSTAIYLWFSLGAGSTYTGTANSWAAADYRGTTGQVNWTGTNGATFYITGVQLEVGSTATSFDYRPYGTELQLCQRYYQPLVNNTQNPAGYGNVDTASTFFISIPTAVQMRGTPTYTDSVGRFRYNGNNITPSGYTVFAVNSNLVNISASTSGATLNHAGVFTVATGATLSAEL